MLFYCLINACYRWRELYHRKKFFYAIKIDHKPFFPPFSLYFFDFRSFEAFIDAVREVNCGNACVADYDEDLASIASTYRTTAILEAGRRSLDEKKAVRILYDDAFNPCRPTSLAS